MRTAVTRAALYAPALLVFVLVPGRAMAGGGQAAEPKASTDAKKKEATSPKAAQQTPTAVQPGEGGLVVIREAETGELSAPVGKEADLLRAVPANNMSDEGLVQVPSPQGGVMLDLKGRFQSYFMVTVQPDGSLKAGCVDHEGHADHDLKATSSAAKEDR